MRFFKKNFFLAFINDLIVDHPSPSNISYLWNFGSLAGISLIIQIITGLFLGMHYVPNIDLAFISVEHIMREVNGGWLFRYLHANGASFFFIFVYIHMFRGLYYGAYLGKNKETWAIGVTLYIFMMATAFLGYVLPWGQMSLWGATVITNFFSIISFVGFDIVTWLWGGFSVNYATLNRFYSLHFFLPFVLVALMFLHLIALHNSSHTNPLGLQSLSKFDTGVNVSFYPYFIIKDLIGLLLAFFFIFFVVFYYPNALGHVDNYTLANPLSTPAHIVPEWYFLPFYAILRSIPNKALGVITMFAAILILYFVPNLHRGNVSSSSFRPYYRRVFIAFIINCMILGWIGGNPVEYPFYFIGQLTTVLYFAFLIIGIPFLTEIENIQTNKWIKLNNSEGKPVPEWQEIGNEEPYEIDIWDLREQAEMFQELCASVFDDTPIGTPEEEFQKGIKIAQEMLASRNKQK